MVQQPNLQPNTVYKQNVFQSLSQLPLTALFTKESLSCDLLKLLIYSGKSIHIICNKATNGRPYGLFVIYCCRLQNNISKSLSALPVINSNYKVKS